MNFEKVVFGFFVLMAATLNFGYVSGDLTDVQQHNPIELFAAVIVNVIATVLKFGDRTQMGAVHLASSLVATIQLMVASAMWVWTSEVSPGGVTPYGMASVTSVALGALLANLVSVVLMVIETANFRRR